MAHAKEKILSSVCVFKHVCEWRGLAKDYAIFLYILNSSSRCIGKYSYSRSVYTNYYTVHSIIWLGLQSGNWALFYHSPPVTFVVDAADDFILLFFPPAYSGMQRPGDGLGQPLDCIPRRLKYKA